MAVLLLRWFDLESNFFMSGCNFVFLRVLFKQNVLTVWCVWHGCLLICVLSWRYRLKYGVGCTHTYIACTHTQHYRTGKFSSKLEAVLSPYCPLLKSVWRWQFYYLFVRELVNKFYLSFSNFLVLDLNVFKIGMNVHFPLTDTQWKLNFDALKFFVCNIRKRRFGTLDWLETAEISIIIYKFDLHIKLIWCGKFELDISINIEIYIQCQETALL